MKKIATLVILFILCIVFVGCTDSNDQDTSSLVSKELIQNNSSEKSIEDTLTKFINIFEIGEEFSSINAEEHTDSMQKTYTINLSNESNSNTIDITTNSYGNLISYFAYREPQENREKNYTIEDASKFAHNILVKLYGDKAKDFKLNIDNDRGVYEDSEYLLSFDRVVNGLEVLNDQVTMTIDSSDLTITACYIYTSTNYDFSDESYFASLDGIKDEEEGLDKFKEENKIIPGYINTDKSSDGSTYKAIYKFIRPQIPISAHELEPSIVGEEEYYGSYYDTGEYDASDISREIQKFEEAKNFEQADKKARNLFDLGDSYQIESSGFSSRGNENKFYIWDLVYSNSQGDTYNINLKADDLSLTYFGHHNYDQSHEIKASSVDEAISKADQFLANKAGVNQEDLVHFENSKVFQNDPESYNFTYFRKLNGQNIFSDYINISVDRNSLEVNFFEKSWDYLLSEDETFQNLDGVDVDELYDRLLDYLSFDLVYIRDYQSQDETLVKPYYILRNEYSYLNDYYLDEHGRPVDERGNEITLWQEIVYSDIDKARRPEIVSYLKEKSIGYLDDLRPTEPVSQIDMVKIFLRETYMLEDINQMSQDELKEYASHIIYESEWDPTSALTYRDISKYYCRMLDYEKIAKLNSIYNGRYEDSAEAGEDYGAMVIARALGIIDEADEKKLNPNKTVSRENALYYYNNYLNIK